ncbi:MAG: hypothetical protein AAB941_00530 [Patescibacteria group bacterium]
MPFYCRIEFNQGFKNTEKLIQIFGTHVNRIGLTGKYGIRRPDLNIAVSREADAISAVFIKSYNSRLEIMSGYRHLNTKTQFNVKVNTKRRDDILYPRPGGIDDNQRFFIAGDLYPVSV